jgi:hypothetical protein
MSVANQQTWLTLGGVYMNTYSKKLCTRFDYPCVCEECKRTPLLYMQYDVTFNVGYDWEDGDSQTVCIPCLIKGKIGNFKWVAKKWVKNFTQYAAPLFFELLFKGKPIGKCWKVAKIFMKC